MIQPTIQIDNLTYRVKKMNAIEALAMRTASSIDSTSAATSFFNDMLERIEVNVGGMWFKVKDGDNYYPANVEDNAETIHKLVDFFMTDFLKPLFTKSVE